jgi:DNA polymerase/3'-5' exonuclease PolX
VAQILEEQGANVFRVGAYRRAAAMLRGLKEPIDQIVKTEGLEGLQKLPGIGETLARFIPGSARRQELSLIEEARSWLEVALNRASCAAVATLRSW